MKTISWCSLCFLSLCQISFAQSSTPPSGQSSTTKPAPPSNVPSGVVIQQLPQQKQPLKTPAIPTQPNSYGGIPTYEAIYGPTEDPKQSKTATERYRAIVGDIHGKHVFARIQGKRYRLPRSFFGRENNIRPGIVAPVDVPVGQLAIYEVKE